ncbi:DVU0298 family protein [Desulfurivibrio sp. C05AmB]|jgi:hypothetical protein|uniref:DVU0298 family protein n=1 Tax=Desulfurivibrio sp. C05AmB TaxID=3374371 RepID=UPI00376F0EDB
MKGQLIKTPPRCPICGAEVERPQAQQQRKLGEFSVGRCDCGAVYASDPTGHNIGSAMIEALVYACNDDWDLAWDLLPGEDYLTGRIESYDEVTHQVLDQRHLDGRYVRGVLYFVRLQREIEEIAHRRPSAKSPAPRGPGEHGAAGPAAGDRPGPAGADHPAGVEPERDPHRKRRKADKKEVHQLALAGDIAALVDLTFDDLKTLRFLQRLLYSPDEAERWWIAHVIGQVCARVASRKPGVVSDLLHRLFEACSDSAAANWGLVETMGSIIAARPDIYGSFSRHLLRYVNHVSTRPLVIWALGTVAARRPDLVRVSQFYQLFGLLDDADPQVRALTIRLLGRAGAGEVRSRLEALARDETPVTIYEEGRPRATTIARLAAEALARIDKLPQ